LINTQSEKLDKRVIRTRKLLLEAFINLMQSQEFQSITVQDITDKAVINRATFYAHFADKYDLADYTIHTLYQEHLEQAIPDADQLNYDNLYALSLATLTFLAQFIGHCAPSKRNDDLPFEKHIQSDLRDILLLWMNDLTFLKIPSSLSTDLIATATSSAILGAALHHARGKSSLDNEAYIGQLMTLLMNGVCPIICD